MWNGHHLWAYKFNLELEKIEIWKNLEVLVSGRLIFELPQVYCWSQSKYFPRRFSRRQKFDNENTTKFIEDFSWKQSALSVVVWPRGSASPLTEL